MLEGPHHQALLYTRRVFGGARCAVAWYLAVAQTALPGPAAPDSLGSVDSLLGNPAGLTLSTAAGVRVFVPLARRVSRLRGRRRTRAA